MELQLVLEYADIRTVLDCMFLSKHIYKVVMQLLAPELALIRKLNVEYEGDVCKGMWCYWELMPLGAVSYSEGMHMRLLHVYATLYTFKESGTLNYMPNAIIVPKRFITDACILIHTYYHKVPKNLILAIFNCVFNRYMTGSCFCMYGHSHSCIYITLAKTILDKGFDVNSLINHRRGANTPLLLYAVYCADIIMIDILLGKRPNVYLTNDSGENAVSAVDNDFRAYMLNPGVNRDTAYTLNVFRKFNELVAEQKQHKK